MASNYTGKGETIAVTAPTAGLTGGDVYVIASGSAGWAGIVEQTTAAGNRAAIKVGGKYRLAKATGTGNSFTQGQVVYWDDTLNRCEPGTTGNTRLGRAAAAASTADTHVEVVLYPA